MRKHVIPQTVINDVNVEEALYFFHESNEKNIQKIKIFTKRSKNRRSDIFREILNAKHFIHDISLTVRTLKKIFSFYTGCLSIRGSMKKWPRGLADSGYKAHMIGMQGFGNLYAAKRSWIFTVYLSFLKGRYLLIMFFLEAALVV